MELASPESLPSEDWISQPRSSAPTSTQGASSPLGALSNGPQSRIPRFKRSTSSSNLPGPTLFHPPPSPLIHEHRKVLNEQSPSTRNASQQLRNGLHKPNGRLSGSLKSRQRGRKSSIDSLDSVQVGTVQHKNDSRPMDHNASQQATPEWKRRVLAGGPSKGGQQDLFSPIGLEQVFKPRNTSQKLPKSIQRRKGRNYEAVVVDEYPSSPPPYPHASPKGSKGDEVASDEEGPTLQEKAPSADRKQSLRSKTGVYIQGERGTNRPRNRVESTGSESRNESISIVQLTNGRIDWDSIADASSNRRARQEKHSNRRKARPSSCASDDEVLCNHGSKHDTQTEEDAIPDLTSQSLPDGLSVDTDVYVSRGGFVNTRRGGCHMDESFQKRPLSPSSFQLSEVLAPDSDAPFRQDEEAHVQSSVVEPVGPEPLLSAKERRIAPTTPRKQVQGGLTSPDPPRSSGSPLKLFDNYDTFTADRLVRRMSQFERSIPDSTESGSICAHNLDLDVSLLRTSWRHGKQRPVGGHDSRVSRFGDGDFDKYDFTHRSSSSESRTLPASIENDERRATSSLLPDRKWLPKSRASSISYSSSSGKNWITEPNRSRKQTRNKDGAKWLANKCQDIDFQGVLSSGEGPDAIYDLENGPRNTEGKRCLASPNRSNPKRRRTITSLPNPQPLAIMQESSLQSSTVQSIAGRKRKDALYDCSTQVADPEVIANRPMLRPRTLTGDLKRAQGTEASSETKSQIQTAYEPEGEPTVDRTVDAPVQALAGELAHFALDIAQDITYGNRKTSVTTADFTSAAMLIMQNIRAQARPRSGRTSDHGSGMDQLAEIEESVNEGSTKDEFSRPPSREGGGTLRRLRDHRQVDPRVISHLRRFEENDETGIALSSSVRSLKLLQDNSNPLLLESDPPNIRIRNTAVAEASHEAYNDDAQNGLVFNGLSVDQSVRSPPSSGPSTARTFPTGSSGGSGNKVVIVPEKVSHLLSDHVAGMTFDRSKQVWIRRKSASSTDTHGPEPGTGDVTEEDLLRGIPDLSVDELEEMRRVEIASQASRPTFSGKSTDRGAEVLENELTIPLHGAMPSHIENAAEKQQPSDGASSMQPKCSGLVSSVLKADTRATKPGHNSSDINNMPDTFNDSKQGQAGSDLEGAEHEISILERRSPSTPKPLNHKYRQPRVVTVAFSSPLVNPMQGSYARACGGDEGAWEDDSELDLRDSPDREEPEISFHSSRGVFTESRPRPTYRNRRKISLGTQNFILRPISRIDEHDESSTVEKARLGQNAQTDMVLSTPMARSAGSGNLSVPPTTGMRSSITFRLSPLSDFTIHQRDETPKFVTKNMERQQEHPSAIVADGVYPIALHELVKKITDVEPYEPYWEYIRKLNLTNKSLATLHMLDDYCTRVEELDVSENELGQLEGAPATLRILAARHNRLSGLTSWAHLRNLQYLDVSGNQIQSLQGFQGLIHLRELKADDNQIGSLHGLEGLDGLLKLRLRGNAITSLDFKDFELQRLVDLDLRDNQIVRVANLQELPALTCLNLRYNHLTDLAAVAITDVVDSLRVLDVSDNQIKSINMNFFPYLETLHIDRNGVECVVGARHLAALTKVSWREQDLLPSGKSVTPQFDDLSEVSDLRLSGNKLRCFSPRVPFLSLQRLELASSGLESLTGDFGLQMPNLRILNLNQNALKDIRPLLGIAKLTALHVAGNRISRLRRTAAVLQKLGGILQTLDLRGNPLTIGFYASQSPSQNKEQQIVAHRSQSLAQLAEEAVCAARYILPAADKDADRQHRLTINEETALRRRVYEMLILGGCQEIRQLDGLLIETGLLERKDMVWKRLLDLGVVKEKDGG